MAKKASPTILSPTEFKDETSSRRRAKRDSIKDYVNDVLTKQVRSDGTPTDLTQTEVVIGTEPSNIPEYQNVSAFRRYQSNAEGAARINAQRQRGQGSSSDEELKFTTQRGDTAALEDSMTELNLDPNPIYEERESAEQIYKQKVYLRQLQPPTPQPLEIQVQEILIKSQVQKPPIHVRVGQREPRTPSPIVIKTAPPQPPPSVEPDQQPILYNKYVPPPKQPPQQIIIHRYPDLPPKPRPIVVEQWLPYKPAPKRIIKHSLPPEALQTPPAPHNLIIAYSKPRAVIQVELVRLPVVRIDPQIYQQISAGGLQQLMQHPTFRHEQDYISRNKSPDKSYDTKPINWRI